ncbi:MAG: hypothetical protein AAB413_00425 [Patescibacteria group bacterium]
MENHLKRVLSLVRKTGDTMIVVDKDGQESFVVMDLDQYEMLLDAQFVDEDWDDGMVEEDVEEAEAEPTSKTAMGPDIWDVMPAAGEEGETWDIDQLDQEEFADLEKQYEAFASRHVKEAIEETKTAPKKKEDDEYGEEQFYLEPIE